METVSPPLKIKALTSLIRPVHVVIMLLAIAVIFFIYLFIIKYSQSHRTLDVPKEIVITTSSTQGTSPSKKEYGLVVPPALPVNLLTEKNIAISQSYELDYGQQKQSTVVFNSNQTVAENYSLYLGFLKKEGWTITKEYSKPDVSFIYARKDANEINITISKQDDKTSTVSISILKL